jgi:hypothetical protein
MAAGHVAAAFHKHFTQAIAPGTRIIRDSPDESQTGINIRVFPALLQERREVLTATSTSRNPNAWSSYFGSATFASLAESTHRMRRQILERFRAEHGDKAIAILGKTHVERMDRHACKLGLEGIVSKRKGSTYRSGRSPDWLKMKNAAAPAVKREAEEEWGKKKRR